MTHRHQNPPTTLLNFTRIVESLATLTTASLTPGASALDFCSACVQNAVR